MVSRLQLIKLSLLALPFGTSGISDVSASQTISSAFKGLSTSSGVASGCTQLCSSYPGKVLTPSSANYTAETKLYWDVRSDLTPACIFQPATANEVADGIKILSRNDAQFAVRGGGHMNVCERVRYSYITY